jgi:ABC-type glycerol-3-phosphate transport system substrate-binding protein
MRKLWISALLGVVVLAGCGSSTTSDDVATSVVVATTTSVEESTPSPGANAYSLIGGGSIDLTRGPTAMPMALWFWAPG